MVSIRIDNPLIVNYLTNKGRVYILRSKAYILDGKEKMKSGIADLVYGETEASRAKVKFSYLKKIKKGDVDLGEYAFASGFGNLKDWREVVGKKIKHLFLLKLQDSTKVMTLGRTK